MSVTTTDTKVSIHSQAHDNHVKSPSFKVNNPLTKLQMMAASCFFGEPSYYVEGGMKSKAGKVNASITKDQMQYLVDVLKGIVPLTETNGKSTDKIMEDAIDSALDFSVEQTLNLATSLRSVDNIRTTPQVIMVRAANHPNSKGTGLIRKYAKAIMLRGDEPAVQMAYQLSKFGKVIPNSLKRSWNDKLSSLPSYQLAKYRMENRTVKTIDVVRVSHANSDAIDQLVYDKLKLNQNTWESLISEKGSDKKTWTEAVEKMGHMALLRNLRNLSKNGVDESLFLQKLIDGVENGKQLPFRYYNAYSHLKEASASKEVLNAVEACMEKSIGHLPKFEGNVAALCDNSGSAHHMLTSSAGTMKVSDIANLTAVLTGMVTDGQATVYPFGDRLTSIVIDKSKGIFDQVDEVQKLAKSVGMGTETGIWLFWDKAIRNKEHLDHVFVYSDMQAGHGQLFCDHKSKPLGFEWDRGSGFRSNYVDVPKLIKEYRKQVNPNVKVYLVQVAGYTDTIVPEVYDKTYIMGGWSAGILSYAHKMQQLNP